MADSTRLKDSALKPWHLKLSFDQQADPDHPADSGTIEEWWAAPDLYRITVASRLYVGSTGRSGEVLFRTAGAERIPALDSDLLGLFISPLPSRERIEKFPPSLVKRPAGKTSLECFVLGFPHTGGLEIPFGTFPSFCTQSGLPGLVALYRWRDETVVVSKLGKFQGKTVATALNILDSGVSRRHAHVEALDTFPVRTADFAPAANEVQINEALTGTPYDPAPKLLKKEVPQYPASSHGALISGTVILDAIISEDGHVESLAVLHSPGPEFSRASLAAVRGWRYEPPMQNGQRVKVHTEITVNFNFKQGV